MPKAEISAVKHIIANTIHETARGDPDGLASRVIAALAEAGYSIVLANGMEDTARGFLPLYHSANGDAWFLARDPATGQPFVRHEANGRSGGQVTDIDLGAFLSGEWHPEQAALLRLIGTLSSIRLEPMRRSRRP
jgi:hypothetical protein